VARLVVARLGVARPGVARLVGARLVVARTVVALARATRARPAVAERPAGGGAAGGGAAGGGAGAAHAGAARGGAAAGGCPIDDGAADDHGAAGAARGGRRYQPPASAGAVALAAARSAREALARTPEQLPVLARAGVVDAGGRGLVVLLDALAEVLTGEPLPAEPVIPSRAALLRSLTVAREAGSDEFGYEVQFLLDAAEPAIGPLKGRLGELGDSVVVVGAEPTWHVHVHVNDVGAAIEVSLDAGRPSRITVTRFADQLVAAAPPKDDERDDHDWAEGSATRAGRAVVVVCSGE